MWFIFQFSQIAKSCPRVWHARQMLGQSRALMLTLAICTHLDIIVLSSLRQMWQRWKHASMDYVVQKTPPLCVEKEKRSESLPLILAVTNLFKHHSILWWTLAGCQPMTKETMRALIRVLVWNKWRSWSHRYDSLLKSAAKLLSSYSGIKKKEWPLFGLFSQWSFIQKSPLLEILLWLFKGRP